ncbi:hypothetical protein [Pseudomonas sp. DR208]|uniref:hypothetical protein n=1 Tax=Pseudomonas sp. DR208 TaxID=2870840 RepID=UPI001C9943EA|nr:hypothetical protein [Pseudomonas sp. DR208]QZP18743.1 hypothetical protein K5K89_15470 [Pseudomonas sp. DR208]
MELIYTNQLEGFEPEKRYRTASLFRGIERGATAVVVVGDHPDIVAAYEAAGIAVSVAEVPEPSAVSVPAALPDELAEEIARLRTENGAVILLADGMEAGEIQRPEVGEIALRLFGVLGTIHTSVGELTTERDGLLVTVDTLRNEVEALKKAAISPPVDETGEIAALKAKLDEAKVPYRANASKESLEKLVADLPKA